MWYKGFQLLFWLICFIIPLIMTTMNPCVPRRISTQDCQFIIRVIIPGTMLQSNKIKGKFRRKTLNNSRMVTDERVLYMKIDEMDCYISEQLMCWHSYSWLVLIVKVCILIWYSRTKISVCLEVKCDPLGTIRSRQNDHANWALWTTPHLRKLKLWLQIY